MVIRAKFRGHNIIEEDGQWIFEDTKEAVAKTWKERACGYCHKRSAAKGEDGCLGTLPGVANACCGHGVEKDAYVQFLDREITRGFKALAIINELKISKLRRTLDT